MNDLISKEWLIEAVEEGWIKLDTQKDYNRIIHLVRDIAPSAQPERKVGHWVPIDDEPHEEYECDVCGYISEATFGPGGVSGNMYNYCPNCGARMEG